MIPELDKSFRDKLLEAIGEDNARVAIDVFSSPASVSARLNPAKIRNAISPSESASRIFGDGITPVPWSPYGFILPERPSFTLDPLFHAGAYYVQDSSSMYVGHVFRKLLEEFPPERTVRVLDLCAAPGGKTTDLAASLREARGDNFLLVSNEVMRQRAAVLASNAALWGDPNVVVTSADAKAFSRLGGFFDIIVADVPCSGEGMFRKDEEALRQWSPDNVTLCSARQRRIAADVWPALSAGGFFVYSTCTFNLDEDDRNVSWMLETFDCGEAGHGDSFNGVLETEHGSLLVPGLVPGEGQYCAAVRKAGELPERRPMKIKQSNAGGRQDLFTVPMDFRMKGDLMIAVPKSVSGEAAVLEPLRPLRTGVAVGVSKGKDFIPDADLALCISLDRGRVPYRDLSRETALSYLHRDAIAMADAPSGIVLVGYENYPLGFVKNLGRRCNNLLPQDRRIRMDIK